LKTKDGVVLAVEKRVTSPLLVIASYPISSIRLVQLFNSTYDCSLHFDNLVQDLTEFI
jgi:hypothetical protein